jgi:hypothetical protein
VSATFSPCRRYRYTLTREWDASLPTVVFCGLNPSTADETQDDPTIRRELAFAKAWGYGKLVKVNAYAFRSTDPKGLWRVDDPCGDDNLGHILRAAKSAELFVAAWGNNIRDGQAFAIRTAFTVSHLQMHALRITKQGNPSHPLYLPQTLKPFPWDGGAS